MDARAFAHFDVTFHLQHDDRLTHHGAANVHLFCDITLGWQFLTDRVDPALNAPF
ncbi:Uncharacterised protein [Serratia fonticola]|uniref:Uncharacterized protein n=1 Tax=Serratia fonticola TaxID=47917 RepID=A0A4U9W879_SERFO|nr:Uncharacterised protein [Serratia fonticola]